MRFLSKCSESSGWDRLAAGDEWEERGLVSAPVVGNEPDASYVRRAFRAALKGAEGVDPAEWTPRELRHGFVSLPSDSGVPLEKISRLVEHSRSPRRSTASRSAP
ncbi:site-specific integrase [Actinacidiphila glaucinigra]|uniref:hypothetical protein n=1 Tax=Actinacidiphila glaucinigra TaxID=235986 RepID=UPI002DD802FD|nr:hypothetical protein [Actinacidiphila glaucinigra]